MKFASSVFLRLLTAACGAALAEVLLDFVDCMIVGNVLGEGALAGLGLFTPIICIVNAAALFVAGGTAVCHSEAMGRFDRARADECFSVGIYTAALLGAVGALALWFGLDGYLSLFGADEGVLSFARAYGRAYVPIVFLFPPMTVLVTMVLEDGDDRLFTFAAVGIFVVNVAASWILARSIGIAGCAYGTLLAELLAILIFLAHFRSKSCSLKFCARFSLPLAGRVLVANPGDAISELMDAVLMFFINGFVVWRFGAQELPVVALIFAVNGLMFVFNGFSNAAQAIVCVYHSERNFRSLKSFAAFALSLAALAGLAISVLVIICPGLMIGLLGIDDVSLVAEAESALRIVATSYVFLAAFSFLNSYYAFIEETALSAVLSVLRAFVMPCVCVTIGGILFGLRGMWIGFAAAVPLALVVFFAALAFTKRRSELPFLLPRNRDEATKTWNFPVTAESACAVSENVERELSARRLKTPAALRTPVLVEELMEVVREVNGARAVRAELTLDLNDGIEVFERDTGVIFDITDADRRFDSFRAYFVTNAMAKIRLRRNLTTIGFNRNRLKLDSREQLSEKGSTSKGENDMELKKKREGEKLTLTLIGRLNTITSPMLETEVENLPEDITDLTFDFTKLEYTSSSGIRLAVAAHEIMEDRGGSFTIVGANAQVKEAFDIARLLSFISFK